MDRGPQDEKRPLTLKEHTEAQQDRNVWHVHVAGQQLDGDGASEAPGLNADARPARSSEIIAGCFLKNTALGHRATATKTWCLKHGLCGFGYPHSPNAPFYLVVARQQQRDGRNSDHQCDLWLASQIILLGVTEKEGRPSTEV